MTNYSGNDNYGKPKQDWLDKLAVMDDATYLVKTEEMIWLSAYANNNPRSDYHWKSDACYDEAKRRGKPELYKQAYDNAVASTQ
jgi:hypothetical protein